MIAFLLVLFVVAAAFCVFLRVTRFPLGRLVFGFVGLVQNADKLWDLLDVTGIVVYVGPNGSGKSLCAVASTLRVLDGVPWHCLDPDHRHLDVFREHVDGCLVCAEHKGWLRHRDRSLADLEARLCLEGIMLLREGSSGERMVFSTVELLDPEGWPHPRYAPLTDYQQLLTIEHADVLFDEVAGVSDSSDSSTVPVQVINWLHQLRKRDVRLRVTTPAYSRCSKPIRQVAQVVVDCRSYFPEIRSDGKLWRPRRGFLMVAYDAFQFDDFTNAMSRQAAKTGSDQRKMRMARGSLWRPGHRAETTYNTLAQVTALGHVNDAGMCSRCGGTRPKPRCGCTDHGHLPAGVTEHISASGARTRKALT